MNIFKKHEEITGRFDLDSTGGSLQSLLTQANQIRESLGRQGYLLDCYLSLFFEVANTMLSYEIGSEGFDKTDELRSLCFNMVDHSEKGTGHPLYSKAELLLKEHKGILDYQERLTRMGLLYLFLADDFLSMCVEQFLQKVNHQMGCEVDFPHLHELYEQIVAVTGENQMEQLNLRLKQRFITAPMVTFYVQGLNNDLMYTLTNRDIETSKQVFQLLLDFIPKDKERE